MEETVKVENAAAVLHSLDLRMNYCRSMLEQLRDGDTIKLANDQVLNMILQILMNQVCVMGAIQTLLVETEKK